MNRERAAKIGWQVFALLLAFGLWVALEGSPQLLRSINVPVEFENMPAELEAVPELPRAIQVELRGSASRLDSLTGARPVVVLNLAGIHTSGDHTLTIEPHNMELSPRVTFVRAMPAQLRLHFERRVEARVPVAVRFATPPPAGYRVVAHQVEPSRLRIAGPESHINQVQSVETDPIDLSRAVGKERFQVHTFLADPQVRFVSEPVVLVSVSLEKVMQGGSAPNGQTTVRH